MNYSNLKLDIVSIIGQIFDRYANFGVWISILFGFQALDRRDVDQNLSIHSALQIVYHITIDCNEIVIAWVGQLI